MDVIAHRKNERVFNGFIVWKRHGKAVLGRDTHGNAGAGATSISDGYLRAPRLRAYTDRIYHAWSPLQCRAM